MAPVLKICFGPPTAESKNLKNHVNFDVGDLFFRSPALWSSQNVFGPPTAGCVVVDFKDRGAINITSDQVTDKLQALNDEFAAMTKKKKDLEDNIDLCSQKLDRS